MADGMTSEQTLPNQRIEDEVTEQTTTVDVTATEIIDYIDDWLAGHGPAAPEFVIDFALDVRSMVGHQGDVADLDAEAEELSLQTV